MIEFVRRRQFWRVSQTLAFTFLGASVVADAQPQATKLVTTAGVTPQQAIVNQYCANCHSKKLKTGGLILEGLDISHVGPDAAVWEKVLRKVHSGEMPPRGLPRPPAAEYAAFSKWLEESLDKNGAANPNPGRTSVHRLNRTEYSNAIRDLLGLDIDAGASLPADNTGYGFDNIADVLSTSPVLLERYVSTARKISRMAVGQINIKPTKEQFEAPRDKKRNEKLSEDLPFDSRGGMILTRYFPMDAEYIIELKMAPDPQVVAAEGIDKPQIYEMRIPLKAGSHTFGVSFPRDSAKAELEAPPGGRRAPAGPGMRANNAAPKTDQMDFWLDSARFKQFEIPHGSAEPEIASLFIDGPYNITGRGDTPSRQKIFVCHPAPSQPALATQEDACAQKILSGLARRAFRRPVTDSDVRPLLAFYKSGRKAGDFDDGIEKALEAVLVSPDFLFRVEHDPKGIKPGSAYQVSDLELASRLSFFLWSSIPDDQLLDLAEKGKLKNPAVLEQQTRRMLEDPKSQALVANFAGQWLYLRNLAALKPDAGVFPQFDDNLRQSMLQQSQLFFESVVRENRSILNLLDADYTFLNQRLAEHYGIPNVYGPQFRRVVLTDPNRRGLLGQGSILTVTSYPNRTSVVQRGRWVLENLLGTPPPPPPEVPEFKGSDKNGKPLTTRQAMELHRTNATCAACHSRMDPIGFALENFDGIGRWRSEDAGAPIDVEGKLPDGAKFNGPTGLSKLLVTSYRDDFVGTFTEKLLTYALGRGLEYYDRPAVRSITRAASSDNFTVSALVFAIVDSEPFRMRRSLEQ